MTQELLTSITDILDSAQHQKLQLADLLDNLKELKQQVQESARESRSKLNKHFESLKKYINEVLDKQLCKLLDEIDTIEKEAVTPLAQCEDVIENGIENAKTILEEGNLILQNDPEKNLDKITKLKENPLTSSLNSVPEIPDRSAVPCISVELLPNIKSQLTDIIHREGKVIAGAAVQITDVIERPGSLLVEWSETDEDADLNEFWLQSSYGNIKSNDDMRGTFDTVYTGPNRAHIVRHLQTNKPYSFRVCGRYDKDSPWSVWSVPYTATTTIPHYQWTSNQEGYYCGYEEKTITRTDKGLTTVIYSNIPSYAPGDQISFKCLETGEKSFTDGIGLAGNKEDMDSLERQGAIFVNTNGSVYVDGKEMKMKLPPLLKGSVVTFHTEQLSNGKLRVGIEVQEKEVTFDWKMNQNSLPNSPTIPNINMQRQFSTQNFYFACKFTHEDWKICVE
ncbi:hypothetical protein LOTGIDRAFT_237190 [Lottia gigantea]|uniref:Fibronectin type-III domain-containing protein n=1 Tax=Lottia gigantea TaxID=225164 RepID=V3ZI53_LOTGI|nr:hypothetical protein LOTGIDRAFT_237190 [Lottia gigantea]ESO81995.1 hypothetical protein LOTGIDRAFT_237190 [Lottia gigantea]